MVVLSAAVTTKSGKVLVARQFVPMTRNRIEGLLAAFPKLIGSDHQHTFIETEDVRYLYQPMENLFMVVVTNKTSNIMEDLDTLRLFAKLVPEYCAGHTEESVNQRKFELIFAFDEVIGLGYKENVTVQQVKTFTEMDSHEEKLQKIILESKMNEARDHARQKAEAIERRKSEMRQQMLSTGGGMGSMGGGSSSSRYGSGGSSDFGSTTSNSPSSGFGSGEEGSTDKPKKGTSKENKDKEKEKRAAASSSNKAGGPSKGMQLGKAKKQEDFVTAFANEEKLVVPVLPPGALIGNKNLAVAAGLQPKEEKNNVQVLIDEKIVVQLDRESTVKNLEVKGELKLTVLDPDDAKCVISTTGVKKEFKPRIDPKLNKASWENDGAIAVAESGKGFPFGSDNARVLVRWRLQSTDESLVPFTLNFWPNVEDGQSVVSAELRMERPNLTLRNVAIIIPCKSSEPPECKKHDGDYSFDIKQKKFVWTLPEVSKDSSASLEFSIPEVDESDFFPINISFTSDNTYSGLQINKVAHAETGKPIQYTAKSVLGVEKFTIE